jgi:hypothetical protein
MNLFGEPDDEKETPKPKPSRKDKGLGTEHIEQPPQSAFVRRCTIWKETPYLTWIYND